ncbi:MAG: sigma-70 family RNA polymerase sigma factor [Phycisphaerales bacterium]|nr:sigma-70 family RNA polymerase sigma factor [Phycisphaerales bacterium]
MGEPAPQPDLSLRTTTTLLNALHDHGNEIAWAQLDHRYRPVIRGLARRLGVPESGAEEVAQQTLSEFVGAYRAGRYDRTKGRLSSWILGIAHHTALRAIRHGRRDQQAGTALLEGLHDESMLRSIWIDERDRAIFSQAMSSLRQDSGMDERTMQAFELVSLRGVPAIEAAQQCRMSVDQVYVAKSRVTRKLRDLVSQMTAAFEDDQAQ